MDAPRRWARWSSRRGSGSPARRTGRPRGPPRPPRRARRASMRGDHLVDEPVLDGLVGLEEAVALHVGVHFLSRLARVLGVDLVDAPAGLEDLLRVDVDVRRLALEAGRG